MSQFEIVESCQLTLHESRIDKRYLVMKIRRNIIRKIQSLVASFRLMFMLDSILLISSFKITKIKKCVLYLFDVSLVSYVMM